MIYALWPGSNTIVVFVLLMLCMPCYKLNGRHILPSSRLKQFLTFFAENLPKSTSENPKVQQLSPIFNKSTFFSICRSEKKTYFLKNICIILFSFRKLHNSRENPESTTHIFGFSEHSAPFKTILSCAI